MCPPKAGVTATALLALALATGACNRGAAEESLQAAEQTLEAARPDLERYAPEELAALSQALSDARADVETGKHTRALRVAQGLPARIRTALAVAERRRRALGAPGDETSRESGTSR